MKTVEWRIIPGKHGPVDVTDFLHDGMSSRFLGKLSVQEAESRLSSFRQIDARNRRKTFSLV